MVTRLKSCFKVNWIAKAVRSEKSVTSNSLSQSYRAFYTARGNSQNLQLQFVQTTGGGEGIYGLDIR